MVDIGSYNFLPCCQTQFTYLLRVPMQMGKTSDSRSAPQGPRVNAHVSNIDEAKPSLRIQHDITQMQ